MDFVPIYDKGKFLGDLILEEDSVKFEPNPLEELPFDNMKNFLENLLPEGARDKWYKTMRRLPSNSTVGYLQIFGEDLAGNLSSRKDDFLSKKPVDRTEVLLDLIEEGAPLDATVKGQKSLLAGADPKIAVIVDGDRFLMPNAKHPSTHILKYNNQLCLNEHFCMRLMERCEIPVAKTKLLCLRGKEVLLIERFDRRNGEKLVSADFCQLLGVSSGNKYKVSWKEIGECLDREGIGHEERERLLDAAYFAIILGCSDDHAKNYSLVGETRENLKFAPFYDVASMSVAKQCSHVYAHLDTTMAKAIDHQSKQHSLKKVHLKKLAQTLGLDPNEACIRFGKVLENIRLHSEDLINELENEVSNKPFNDQAWGLHQRFFKTMRKTIEKETRFFENLCEFPSDNPKP